MGEENDIMNPFDRACDWIGEMLFQLSLRGSVSKDDVDFDFFRDNDKITLESIKQAFIDSYNKELKENKEFSNVTWKIIDCQHRERVKSYQDRYGKNSI